MNKIDEIENHEKASKIKNTIQKIVGVSLQNNKIITAKEAYLRTLYGTSLKDENRLKEFIYKINNEMTAKRSEKLFHCIVDVPIDIEPFIQDIISKYAENGYIVKELSGIFNDVHKKCLFFSWDEFK